MIEPTFFASGRAMLLGLLAVSGVLHYSGRALAQSGCYPGLPCAETQPPPPPPPVQPATREPADNLTKADLQTVLKDYISAWKNGDISAQDELLSDDFYYSDERGKPSGYQGRNDYLSQKRRLSADNDWIEVRTVNPAFSVEGATGTISYRQLYNNPKYCSLGTNKFLVRKEGGVAKIYREVFNADRRIPKPNGPTRTCPASLS